MGLNGCPFHFSVHFVRLKTASSCASYMYNQVQVPVLAVSGIEIYVKCAAHFPYRIDGEREQSKINVKNPHGTCIDSPFQNYYFSHDMS